ncbi:MAG: hypothetical protein IPH09_15240 [bacterium]|nr:hypothetical protein [bacterium]
MQLPAMLIQPTSVAQVGGAAQGGGGVRRVQAAPHQQMLQEIAERLLEHGVVAAAPNRSSAAAPWSRLLDVSCTLRARFVPQ